MPKNKPKLVYPKNTKKPQKSAPGRENPTWCCLILSARFRLWVTVWVRRKTKKYDRIILMKYKEKFLISQAIRNFLVETTGLEPVASCV
jgi:hypothetical protein